MTDDVVLKGNTSSNHIDAEHPAADCVLQAETKNALVAFGQYRAQNPVEPGRIAAPIGRLRFHPLADIFPMLEGQPMRELAQDIAEHGLLEPLVLYEGQILDGRCRYLACEAAEAEPRYEDYLGNDPISFVLSKNAHRRHLTTGQLAMIGEWVANLTLGRPKKNPSIEGISQEAAAKSLGISVASVERAHVVRQHGTGELIAAVERGQLPVSAAAEIAKRPAAQQRDALSKRLRKSKRSAEVIAAEKKEKADREAAKKAAKVERARAQAENEALLRNLAAIIFELPDQPQRSLIQYIDQAGIGVTLSDLASCMRQMRPGLFDWEDEEAGQ